MSLNDLQAHKLIGGATIGGGGSWQRPSDWLEMPTVLETEEKFVGLFAVYDLPENFVALQFEGEYEVDWGDGNIEQYTSGTIAEHSYSWSSISSDTLTSSGYRQVIVTVIPQPESFLGAINITPAHQSTPYAYGYPWLDIVLSLPQATPGTTIAIGGQSFQRYVPELQKLLILNTGDCTDLTYAVYFCTSLRKAEIYNCSNVQVMDSLFEECYALENVTISDATSCSSLYCAFAFCYSLENINLTGTHNVVDCANMFRYCYSLVSAPVFDTSSVESMHRMFEWCSALTEIPQYTTVNLTNMYFMFENCYSLLTIPLLNTSQVTNISLGWCPNLRYLPRLDASSVNTDGITFNSASLQIGTLIGVSVNLNYSGCSLGRLAIVDIFNELGTVSGKTINISTNYGVADLISTDYDIATGKGWTVIA